MLRTSQLTPECPAVHTHEATKFVAARVVPCLRLAVSTVAESREASPARWQPSSHVLWFGPGVSLKPFRAITDNQ
jgi:hypothetical protein